MILSESVEFVFKDCSDNMVEKFCHDTVLKKPTHVFLHVVWETWDCSQYCLVIDEYLHSRHIPTTWVTTTWAKDNLTWKQLKNPVFFIDFCLLRAYREVVERYQSKINFSWRPDADQWLFLTGKPFKVNRAGLLYRLYQQNLLAQCNYSFFMHAGMWQQTKAVLPPMSDAEFVEFITQHQRTPDNISPQMQTQSMHYGGIPYNCEIYSNSLFRLVSETGMHYMPPWLSEKTYLTILNNQPFVIAGDINSCQYLRSLGFETFDTMFNIDSYDGVVGINERLDAVTEHVKQWLNRNFDPVRVKQMIEHNFRQLESVALNTRHMFKQATGYSLTRAVSTKDHQQGR